MRAGLAGARRKTGEVVVRKRIRPGTIYPYSGDVEVSSSDSSHEPFVIKERTESCPDRLSWYKDFRYANTKTVFEARQSPAPQSRSGLLPRRRF